MQLYPLGGDDVTIDCSSGFTLTGTGSIQVSSGSAVTIDCASVEIQDGGVITADGAGEQSDTDTPDGAGGKTPFMLWGRIFSLTCDSRHEMP